MSNIAYSYIRFSKPEQSRGHSLSRQLEKTIAYCKTNNLTLDSTLTLHDIGISAFKGKNLESGSALNSFLLAIDEGLAIPGSSLIIESLDRLSRQEILPSLGLFSSILKKGIKIITLADNTVYTEDSLNDVGQLIVSITIMSRAHEESKMKSMRLLAANKNKRKNIKTKKLTSIRPAWLAYNKDKDEFIPIHEKVKIIKLIFELSDSGLGTYATITELTNKNIKPIGKSNTWHQGYLSKILKGREVLGEFTSNSKDGKQVYKNYYPAIIDEDLYYRVQNAIASRNHSGGGRKGSKTANIFQKIIICGYSIDNNKSGYKCAGDNETVIVSNKSTKKKKGQSYLQCYRNKRSNSGCTSCRKLWRLDRFETSFLSFVKNIDVSLLTNGAHETKNKINETQNSIKSDSEKIKHIEDQINKIGTASLKHEGNIPDFYIRNLNSLEEDKIDLTEKIKSNTEQLKLLSHELDNSDQNKQAMNDLIRIMPTLDGENLYNLRQKLSILLQSIIKQIEVFSCGNIITDELISNVRKTQGIKAENILKKQRDQEGKKCLPYFIVRFKSGLHQVVATDPNDPTRLIISIEPNFESDTMLFD